MEGSFDKKRYMKFTQTSGCILADYSLKDCENSIFPVTSNTQSGISVFPSKEEYHSEKQSVTLETDYCLE